ncbi:site-specific integrase [Bacillus bruguierae]|uniref:site-specific integrase n=1 Tax=Bacillus bruguierae TaxID=3127667 RepID=UPI0039B76D0E
MEHRLNNVDDFLMYLPVEKNYSENTLRGYTYDWGCYQKFLVSYNRSLELTDLTTSTSRRFIQDQVINYKVKPRALHRRISCLKSFSQYCLKENYISI